MKRVSSFIVSKNKFDFFYRCRDISLRILAPSLPMHLWELLYRVLSLGMQLV